MAETIQPNALAIIVSLPVLSTIFVGLRVGFRAWTNQFRSDDGLCLLAWALAVANAGVMYRFIKVNYIGYHIWDVPEQSIEEKVYSGKLSMAQQLLYNPILCLVKASIIIFLIRLGDIRRKIRYSLIIFFIFNLGHMIAVFFGALTQCLPIHMYWEHHRTDEIIDGEVVNPNYSCFHEEAFSMSTAAIAILTDILILIIPIAMVWPLRINRRKKLAVGCVLSLGWVVVAIGLYRIKSFYDFWNVVNPDPTYALGSTVSVVEVNVAIILCCGPAINAIVNYFAPKVFRSRNGTKPTGYTANNPTGYEMSSGRPRRYRLPGLSSTRDTERSYRMMDDGEVGNAGSRDEIMNNDSLDARRAEIIKNMIDNEENGKGMYVR